MSRNNLIACALIQLNGWKIIRDKRFRRKRVYKLVRCHDHVPTTSWVWVIIFIDCAECAFESCETTTHYLPSASSPYWIPSNMPHEAFSQALAFDDMMQTEYGVSIYRNYLLTELRTDDQIICTSQRIPMSSPYNLVELHVTRRGAMICIIHYPHPTVPRRSVYIVTVWCNEYFDIYTSFSHWCRENQSCKIAYSWKTAISIVYKKMWEYPGLSCCVYSAYPYEHPFNNPNLFDSFD